MKSDIWGVELSVDLKGCDPETIRSSKKLEEFLIKVCKHLAVKRWGDPIITDFGNREEIAGYSIVQLIETSLISGHFVEKTNAAYINLFSCNYFDPLRTVNFTKKFFKAKSAEFLCNYRMVA